MMKRIAPVLVMENPASRATVKRALDLVDVRALAAQSEEWGANRMTEKDAQARAILAAMHNARRVEERFRYREAGAMMDDVEFAETALEFWHHVRWMRGGGVVFDFGEELANALMETEARVSGAELRVPVPACYLALPSSVLRAYLPTARRDGTRILGVDGMHVTLTEPERGLPRRLSVSIVVLLELDEKDGPATGTQHIYIPLEGWAEGETLEDRIVSQDAIERLTPLARAKYQTMAQEIGEAPEVLAQKDAVFTLACYRFAANAILYLTSEERDVEEGPLVEPWVRERAKAQPKTVARRFLDANKIDGVRYSVVGRHTKIDANLARHASADAETRRLTRRFIVRGHWRMQAHGEERALRTRKWIAPHWKGPPWAEIIGGAGVRRVEDA